MSEDKFQVKDKIEHLVQIGMFNYNRAFNEMTPPSPHLHEILTQNAEATFRGVAAMIATNAKIREDGG